MGRKRLNDDVKIDYFSFRINSEKFPFLADFLKKEENVAGLICILLESSKPFFKYVERRKSGINISNKEAYEHYDVNPEYMDNNYYDTENGYALSQPIVILGGFYD